MNRRWSKNMENKLVKLYPNNSDERVAEMIGISVSMVKRIADELGLEKVERKEWTPEEQQFLQVGYPNKSNDYLASMLSIDKMQIEHMAYRMALRKSKEYMSEHVADDESGLAKQWHDEWNSGMGCSRGHYVCRKILEYLFPEYRVIEEHPIGSLRIDLYIPSLKIALEYNGVQHDKFNSFFHNTKYDFAKGQANDYRKSEMLESQDIALIAVYHDEKLSINLIRQKIEEVI